MERHNISPMKVICGQIRLLLFKGHLMRILLLGMMIVMRQSNSYLMKSLLILSTIIIVLIIITIRGIIKESRMALTSLQRMHEVPDVTDIERRELMGRCYFLVGYYYYQLMFTIRTCSCCT